VRQIGDEIGNAIDKRRFRANLCLDLAGQAGFAENAYVGKTLRLGKDVLVHVVERDPRCAMITLDPDTAERDFRVIETVRAKHEGKAGIYAAVLAEGVVAPGDEVALVG
jgi:hypothetical protein